MELQKGIATANASKNRVKIGAKVCLIVLLLYIIGQLVDAWRTQYQLVSPCLVSFEEFSLTSAGDFQ